jgi:hypothetical protein
MIMIKLIPIVVLVNIITTAMSITDRIEKVSVRLTYNVHAHILRM